MRAALRLRLLEAWRRGGGLLFAGAIVVVGWVAFAGGDTPDGRYGLASDLAATFAYLAALFTGAFPLAFDRERRRAYLPAASPARPWAWALGNALGAGLVAAVVAFLLFAAAGAGAALGGGVETTNVMRFARHGTGWLPLRITNVPEDATRLRLVPRVHLTVDEVVGTEEAARIAVNGEEIDVYADRPVVVPIRGPVVEIVSLGHEHAVGVAREEIRVLGARRPFLGNAVAAAVAPALGAAALAVFGCAAGANLSAPVAALLTALILLLASTRGFLRDTIAHEGATQVVHGDHVHGPAEPSGTQVAARTLVAGILAVVYDLGELDATGEVARGEWAGARGWQQALLYVALALAFAAVLGGVGVHLRRLP